MQSFAGLHSNQKKGKLPPLGFLAEVTGAALRQRMLALATGSVRSPAVKGVGVLCTKTGLGPILWWLLASGFALAFSALGSSPELLERFAFEKAEMGLPVRVTLYAPSESIAHAAADEAFCRIEALNAVFTDYDSDSELSRLSDSSGSGQAHPVSEELWLLLSFAQDISKRSGGAFDMTVGPLVNLWRTARRKKELPPKDRLAEALGRTGYEAVRLNESTRTVELTKPRMRLDAGGIAKGYAIEEALRVLQQKGFRRSMVSGGGDLALGDPPPGEQGWRVEIVALDVQGAPEATVLRLSNCSVATSGDLYQRLEIEGKRYSHIVDPRTGIGLTDHSLVSVVAKRGIEADAFSKVLAVLGPEKGWPILEGTPGIFARVLRAPDGMAQEWCSSGWPPSAGPTGVTVPGASGRAP